MRHTEPLRLNRDFKRTYARGRSLAGPLLALYARPNRSARTRLGLTVGAKLGKAVRRNRVRRRIKEAYRLSERRFRPGHDLVVVARVRAGDATYAELERELLRLMARLGLVVAP
ncbi:MAG: ribonuclease P protein component [Oscillospiraceae bacterium]|jgi:ribonuclease P protein component|nr:ribonuclease P protein component [Oscillospiraceae bacterium]